MFEGLIQAESNLRARGVPMSAAQSRVPHVMPPARKNF